MRVFFIRTGARVAITLAKVSDTIVVPTSAVQGTGTATFAARGLTTGGGGGFGVGRAGRSTGGGATGG